MINMPEVPRLQVESELQLLAYTIDTVTQDPSHICDLHHSSGQHQILNPLSKAVIKPVSSWIQYRFISAKPCWELPMKLNFINHFLGYPFQKGTFTNNIEYFASAILLKMFVWCHRMTQKMQAQVQLVCVLSLPVFNIVFKTLCDLTPAKLSSLTSCCLTPT